jgi:hypothetical protein
MTMLAYGWSRRSSSSENSLAGVAAVLILAQYAMGIEGSAMVPCQSRLAMMATARRRAIGLGTAIENSRESQQCRRPSNTPIATDEAGRGARPLANNPQLGK